MELKILNNFFIVNLLGTGGQAEVYRAIQVCEEDFQKTVVIKLIKEQLLDDKEHIGLFINEAKLVTDLIHENIVEIYQFGKFKNKYFMVLEYIHGMNLIELVSNLKIHKKKINQEMAIFIVSRVARALAYAHSKKNFLNQDLNIVHCDVTPSNIMISWEGVVKLADFGIARFKHKHSSEIEMKKKIYGKFNYMSKEQTYGEELDNRSDIFSLGVILYELLSGQNPFKAKTEIETIDKIRKFNISSIDKLAEKGIDGFIINVLKKAMNPDKEKRYPDADKFGYDLEYFMYSNKFGPTNNSLKEYLFHNLKKELKQIKIQETSILKKYY